MTSPPLAVEMENIVIRFPGVLANDHVNFTLKKGEIHALLGENGAGKSTLMNALSGLYEPSSGTIRINGEVVNFKSPRDAIEKGVGMVHQHFMLVPTQTVTENILLGMDEPRFFMNLNKYHQKILDLQDRFGLRVDPRAKIWQLSVGEQQRVEILKTLYRGAEILILDEPTAVLSPREITEFMETMRSLCADDKSIVFITHKLREVVEVADRVTVLRKGKVTGAGEAMEGVTKKDLAEKMVGREVIFTIHREPQEHGEVVLEMEDVSALNNRGLPALKNVSLTVRSGEILGIAGVGGNGQSELAEVITGLRQCQGRIEVQGQDISNRPPINAINQGVSHIPEDRTEVGTAPSLSLTDNTIMKEYRKQPIGDGWRINFVKARDHTRNLKEKYNILAPSIDTPAGKLSGGNLQKLILAREISSSPNFMVAMQPTRGLDVGAIEAIRELLLEQRKRGTAILLISEELEEVMSLSDRIAVISEGKIMGVLDAEEADIETIGLMMTGTGEDREIAQR